MAIQFPSNISLFLTLVTFLIYLSLFNVSMASDVDPRVGIAPLGGFQTLNASDPKGVTVGKFAVVEHNKGQGKPVVFEKVVWAVGEPYGEDQYKYVLNIAGAEYDTQEHYSATVLDMKYAEMKLVAFKKILGV